MRAICFFAFFLFAFFCANAQGEECYTRLLKNGISEFDRGNFDEAKVKWKSAKEYCPVTSSQKQVLENWIAKANASIAGAEHVAPKDTKPKKTSKPVIVEKVILRTDTIIIEKPMVKTKEIIRTDTIEKIILRTDTVIIEKPVERIVEKIIYEERPEAFHRFGKGNGNLVIYASFGNEGILNVWIDGKFEGIIDSYFKNGAPSCGDLGTVSKIVTAGVHHIGVVIGDQKKGGWEGFSVVKEDECRIVHLHPRR